MIEMQDWKDCREPYPLSWEEQRRLFRELPPHLQRMALFAVNTGARQEEVCGLKEYGVKPYILHEFSLQTH
jgi:hypothetical protein